MNKHALTVIELPRVLELVAGHASSDLGAERVRALHPSTDRSWIAREQTRVAAMRSLVRGDSPWSPGPIPPIAPSLARLVVEGVVWSAPEFLEGGTLLRSSRLARESLTAESRSAMARSVLEPITSRLVSLEPVERAIESTILDDGTVSDSASPLLRRIRQDLRSSNAELIRILERALSRLSPQARVADMSVTVRSGRYVIPVRRDAVREIGGIVHDTSASGATLFVEPPAAVEFGNKIRELEADEAEEVERILLALTDKLRPDAEAIADALDAMIELDTLFARARYAMAFDCGATTLADDGAGFTIVNGRHPLLLAQDRPVVPFDLEMHPGEQTLLISGPNTGGKTVLLKGFGLLSAMVQAGIPAPAGAESRVRAFDDIFADVGDEQSISASLSTFSAHIKNISDILREATSASLVLLDEVGSGTDPVEGAALGAAVIETLTTRGTTTAATTHLGALKELASRVEGVVNASLHFDSVALAPTYRLIKGVPGRSYGIAIARRLAIPEDVIRRAEESIPEQERESAALIARLETLDATLAARQTELDAMLADVRERAASLGRREHNVRERERTAEREGRKEARRYLLSARGEIEKTIKKLEATADADRDALVREARNHAEQLAAREAGELDRLAREDANVSKRASAEFQKAKPGQPRPIAAGDLVAITTLGGKIGRVLELRDDHAIVSAGGIKLTVLAATLAASDTKEPLERAVAWSGDLPEEVVQTEIDLRGMRADEAESVVLQAVDAAIRADLKALRIIHGKGTGALRERVTEMVRKDSRVRGFRIGAWNEGGTGVTIVDLP